MTSFPAITTAQAVLPSQTGLGWQGDPSSLVFDEAAIHAALMNLNDPVWVHLGSDSKRLLCLLTWLQQV